MIIVYNAWIKCGYHWDAMWKNIMWMDQVFLEEKTASHFSYDFQLYNHKARILSVLCEVQSNNSKLAWEILTGFSNELG